jgi:hypothetical protein
MLEPEEGQFCSDELSRCDCEFLLAIEGLASVYGCGCDGLELTMDQVGAHNELSPSLIQLTMDPASCCCRRRRGNSGSCCRRGSSSSSTTTTQEEGRVKEEQGWPQEEGPRQRRARLAQRRSVPGGSPRSAPTTATPVIASKDCGGKQGICVHKQQRHTCKECGGSSVCTHKQATAPHRCKQARSAVVRASAPTQTTAHHLQGVLGLLRASAPTNDSAKPARTTTHGIGGTPVRKCV